MRYKCLIAIFATIIFLVASSFSIHRSLIQGKWISTTDHRSVLVITGDKFTELYNGTKKGSYTYYIGHQSCDTAYYQKSNTDFLKIS